VTTAPTPVDALELPAGPQGSSPSGAPVAPSRRVPGRKLWLALRHNPKALAGALLLLFFLVLAVFPGQIAPYSPTSMTFAPGLGPSAAHWLGTTAQGQDVLSQLVWGTQQTLVIAFAAGGISTVLSILVGVSAAYLGGITDGVLSLLTDVLLVIPIFPLIIVIAAYLNNAGTLDMIVVLGALGWSYGARQLRSQVLSLRNRDFLEAARVRGERSGYIIVGEVMPTLTSLIVATFLGSAVYAVLAAAGLQFIGLGDPNALSWGTMLYWAQSSEALQAGMPLWAIMPGLFVALLGAAFALLNYAFDEISNPALRPVRRLSRVPFAAPPLPGSTTGNGTGLGAAPQDGGRSPHDGAGRPRRAR
jgi:peptide/nickel transport system permease protein